MPIKQITDAEPDGSVIGQTSSERIGFYGVTNPIARRPWRLTPPRRRRSRPRPTGAMQRPLRRTPLTPRWSRSRPRCVTLAWRLMKLVLATGLTGGTGFGPFFSSLNDTLRTLDRAGIEAHFWAAMGAAYIDDMRNEHVAKFLATDATHLVFLDYDMEWDFAAFQRLITADVPVVSGTYRLKSQIMRWTAIPEYDEEGGLIGIPRSDGDGWLVEAAGIPAGFTCYKREVFEKMPTRRRTLSITLARRTPRPGAMTGSLRIREGNSHFGEDFSFSLRWKRLGGKLWIDPNLTLKHWGMFGWRGNQHEQWLHEKELAERFPSAIPLAAE